MLMNAIQQKPLYKVAIYGPPGTGKTHMGALAPDPLILLLERHGYESIRTASVMNGRPIPPVIWVRSLKQLKRIATILASDPEPIAAMMMDPEVVAEGDVLALGLDRAKLVKGLPYKRPKTVVLDSVSEACEMVAASVDSAGGTESDKSGLEYRKLKAWGPITDKGVALIRTFRDLPYHVLFLALMNERNHGDDTTPDMHYEPALPGRQLPKKLVQVVNACGVAVLSHINDEKTGRRVGRWVRFITTDRYASKAATPLREREPADPRAWFDALENKIPIKVAPEQIVTGGESVGPEQVNTNANMELEEEEGEA